MEVLGFQQRVELSKALSKPKWFSLQQTSFVQKNAAANSDLLTTAAHTAIVRLPLAFAHVNQLPLVLIEFKLKLVLLINLELTQRSQ
jgi:hypothetical protein